MLMTGNLFREALWPILQKNCQACHRPEEIAPMSFLTYQDVRPWAKAIKAAVVRRQMPPWFADPAYGHFANDKRLTDADIATLSAWVDGGAVEETRWTGRRRLPFTTDGISSRT
jgi:mono/diheme cytochrome c family protein